MGGQPKSKGKEDSSSGAIIGYCPDDILLRTRVDAGVDGCLSKAKDGRIR